MVDAVASEIKLRINNVYRGIDYSMEADILGIESAEQVVSLMRQVEQFIDRMLEKVEREGGRNRNGDSCCQEGLL
jgi:hypothetical protein